MQNIFFLKCLNGDNNDDWKVCIKWKFIDSYFINQLLANNMGFNNKRISEVQPVSTFCVTV